MLFAIDYKFNNQLKETLINKQVTTKSMKNLLKIYYLETLHKVRKPIFIQLKN